jgi:glycosyltransferase involved in cell wall biosynthesis
VSRPRTLIFLPAWNERESLPGTLQELRAEFAHDRVDLLVCDDGSTDGTGEAALAAGVAVVDFPFHLGIGAAVHAGYLYAQRHGYRFCAHCDADGQHPARELRKLLEVVWDDRADLVVGSRYLERATNASAPAGERYRASFPRRIGIALFRALLSWQTGRVFTDTTSGIRAANERAIALFARRYASDYPELESLQQAVGLGLRVEEVAVWVRPRTHGRSKITLLRSAHFVWKSLFAILVGLLPGYRQGAGP